MGEPTFTKGPWRKGNGRGNAVGAVVADHPVPGMGGSDAVDYYGGHLIAESIAPQNRDIVAAAPDLYDACVRAEQWVSTISFGTVMRDVLRTAILKARGQ